MEKLKELIEKLQNTLMELKEGIQDKLGSSLPFLKKFKSNNDDDEEDGDYEDEDQATQGLAGDKTEESIVITNVKGEDEGEGEEDDDDDEIDEAEAKKAKKQKLIRLAIVAVIVMLVVDEFAPSENQSENQSENESENQHIGNNRPNNVPQTSQTPENVTPEEMVEVAPTPTEELIQDSEAITMQPEMQRPEMQRPEMQRPEMQREEEQLEQEVFEQEETESALALKESSEEMPPEVSLQELPQEEDPPEVVSHPNEIVPNEIVNDMQKPDDKEEEVETMGLGEGVAPTPHAPSQSEVLKQLADSATSNTPMIDLTQKIKEELTYEGEPNYEKLGRGLVYNCKGKHWACVDREEYMKCRNNQQYALEQLDNPECATVSVYAEYQDCKTMQIYNINTAKGTGFCDGQK